MAGKAGSRPGLGFLLKSLASDDRGSALPMMAAALIPMIGIIGFGVDISRAYLAKTRLQQACDAGVLGGRKVMTNGLETKVTDEVRKFVDYDFPQGTLQTENFAIDPRLGDKNALNLSLATKMPTALMRLLGTESIDIGVSCTARQDYVNTDVMLVLDTTLSMNCKPSDSGSSYCPSEKSGSKLAALKAATNEFYSSLAPAQAELETAGLRLRYGIVPYSMTVNVGKLIYAKNSAWIRDPALYRTNSKSVNPVKHDPSWFANVWSGCIEERDTKDNIRKNSGYTPPSGAYDLDIDSAPNGNGTKWNPYDPAEAKAKSGNPGLDHACPLASSPMKAFSASQMSSYVGNLKAGGFTYHDIGLIWGARLMAPNGIWSSDNPSTHANFPVNRHLIFMTDGMMDPDPSAYTAYGIERYDQRVTGNGSESAQKEPHLQRFRMMCNQIKDMNINIWVVAFGKGAGTGLSADLQNCANSPNQAFKADDEAALIARFKEIGQAIGALRLSDQ